MIDGNRIESGLCTHHDIEGLSISDPTTMYVSRWGCTSLEPYRAKHLVGEGLRIHKCFSSTGGTNVVWEVSPKLGMNDQSYKGITTVARHSTHQPTINRLGWFPEISEPHVVNILRHWFHSESCAKHTGLL
jgi:hypothetical protein